MDRRGQQGQVVLNTSDVGSLVVSGVKSFAKKHKIITGSYLFGIIVLLIGGTGTKLTLDKQRAYNDIMNTIDVDAEYHASNRYAQANANYRATKGWFTCDSSCQRNKRKMEDAKLDLDAILKEGYGRMSDAKSVAGLFSEVGVGEAKDSFWASFASGKRFAKRQSMWDAMFMGMRSMGRDESLIEYVLKVLLQVLINFSLGLIMALFVFIFGLWSIIKSYQPDPLTAMAFFLSAVCAAFAFVTTYLLLFYGAAAGGLYGVAKLAESNARIEGAQGQRRPVRNRPHYQ
eukprot:CAMPEP_0195524330 /NCGR_PEP_ID=MMETSP0794_2-20130614/24083_1 /TAXON_ID=515487 /ORGANISM="Stephanopyxis turris, Strain CCMP 815" /LENGTH=286 /DNA_ID=CAMNT_0040654525 /DNA_START=137 /DNA_END=997 /DNA_ORIENTATION=+